MASHENETWADVHERFAEDYLENQIRFKDGDTGETFPAREWRGVLQ